MPNDDLPAVSYHFDPVCPWTWNTSRWLVEVAAAEGFEITWRTFSLAIVNEGGDVPEQYRRPMRASQAALRVIEAARAAGDDAKVGDLYTELGRRWHHDKVDHTVEGAQDAARSVGLGAHVDAATDESWDDALRASIAEARALVGDDVGSPVLRIGDAAAFGPILSPPPTGDEALVVWRAVRDLVALPRFFELKRSRTGPPAPGPRP